MVWEMVATVASATFNASAENAALNAELSAKGIRPKRDTYPLRQKPTPSYWDGFKPLPVPVFYALAIVAALAGIVWIAAQTPRLIAMAF